MYGWLYTAVTFSEQKNKNICFGKNEYKTGGDILVLSSPSAVVLLKEQITPKWKFFNLITLMLLWTCMTCVLWNTKIISKMSKLLHTMKYMPKHHKWSQYNLCIIFAICPILVFNLTCVYSKQNITRRARTYVLYHLYQTCCHV